ncbi:uncharacterized protein LOC129801652 [Phlebotomus papatasi]|uniref:uncharacterized protein LOC129801652 n=1 Tax=Phlebotomus papatasi TaxID=29031 RepID=UPI002483F385|nr:uncharacterized protein LOC129801652 [Phlebotomus papatasi]
MIWKVSGLLVTFYVSLTWTGRGLAVSLNVTPEEVVSSTSKSGPKPVRKRALSKDEDVTKPKRRRRGRKPMAAKAADKGAVKRKKGRPRLKPLREEGGLQSPATDTTCSTPRFRGPYVQVRGNGVACVINTPQTEEDGERVRGVSIVMLATRGARFGDCMSVH